MEFTDWNYFRFGRDFGLDSKTVEQLERFPSGLVARQRVVEEVLETFVALHLERVTGLPLEYVSRGHRNWAGEDLIAWDRLGRIHLFELKKETINEQVISQLMQYTMRHLFRPVDTFVEQKWRNRRNTLGDGLATYLAGAYANERTTKLGCAYVGKNLPEELRTTTGYEGEWPISQYWWDKQGSSTKAEVIFESLLNSVRSASGTDTPGLDPMAVHTLATEWTKKTGKQRRPPRPNYQEVRPVVLWLVAPNVTDGALEQVRQWRAMGLDTRVVNVDLRKRQDEVSFHARIRREDFPKRDQLESQFFNRPTAEALRDRIPRVELHFYKSSSPSSPANETEGSPLDKPWARVEEVQKTEWETVSL